MTSCSRRELLAAGLAAALPAWPARLLAARAFVLDAEPIGEGTFAVYGRREFFTPENGGHIVNTAFIDTADGAVVIDTGSSRLYGEALRDLVRATTGKDVVRAYVTHHHPDHFLGAQAFPRESLAALPGTIANIEAEGDALAENLYRLLGDWMQGTEVVTPGIPLRAMTERFGDHVLTPIPLSGHTSADLALLDERTGILFAGDLVFLDRAPTTPHADLPAWRRALGEIGATGHRLLAPGHGPAESGGRAIAQTLDWLDWLEAELTRSVDQGLDAREAMDAAIPSRFDQLALAEDEYRRSVAHLYADFEEALLPVSGTTTP
jgi:quinoprotein relay system zinc metallohydrolase 1